MQLAAAVQEAQCIGGPAAAKPVQQHWSSCPPAAGHAGAEAAAADAAESAGLEAQPEAAAEAAEAGELGAAAEAGDAPAAGAAAGVAALGGPVPVVRRPGNAAEWGLWLDEAKQRFAQFPPPMRDFLRRATKKTLGQVATLLVLVLEHLGERVGSRCCGGPLHAAWLACACPTGCSNSMHMPAQLLHLVDVRVIRQTPVVPCLQRRMRGSSAATKPIRWSGGWTRWAWAAPAVLPMWWRPCSTSTQRGSRTQ